MRNEPITFANTHPDDIAAFKKELQDAFALAVVDEFGELPDGPIPSDEVLDGGVNAPVAVTLRILCDGRKVGGAVVTVTRTVPYKHSRIAYRRRNRIERLFGHLKKTGGASQHATTAWPATTWPPSPSFPVSQHGLE
ncbi:hypothetical protein SAMN04488125_12231 [Methylorubrum salsuginis]|uniref:Transposase DDE domain-containing protein n=1 Tax=Methylorubrum salsuginis TaxID=414703 RepID=A0A1I4JYQ9_9HYPH|nr:hypothetical protein SAMN04488125_12231 [Methylorubrum salsuginis]